MFLNIFIVIFHFPFLIQEEKRVWGNWKMMSWCHSQKKRPAYIFCCSQKKKREKKNEFQVDIGVELGRSFFFLSSPIQLCARASIVAQARLVNHASRVAGLFFLSFFIGFVLQPWLCRVACVQPHLKHTHTLPNKASNNAQKKQVNSTLNCLTCTVGVE